MERKPRSHFVLIVLLACLAVVPGCDKLKARDLLNKGVQAYKGGQYDAAIEDFKQSKQLDPGLTNARLYLATAYSAQYIPGAPSEENVRMGEQAINEYKEVWPPIPTIFRPSTASARFFTTWVARPLTPRNSRNPSNTT